VKFQGVLLVEVVMMRKMRFFEMLMRCQSSRLEDQRSSLPTTPQSPGNHSLPRNRGLTVPDEDFFLLIARLQDKRMDDQRADIKDLNLNLIE